MKLPDPADAATGFEVSIVYEGEEVFHGKSLPAPAEGPEAAPGGAPTKLALPLLRGRNEVTVRTLTSPARETTFPIFYKTALRDWIESILKALIILVLIQFFVVQTFYIPTASMELTLRPGDYIMVEKVSYLFTSPSRGDVVVFQFPEDPRKDFIKRMVARERDTLEVIRKRLIVNGRELVEPYTVHMDRSEDPLGQPQYRPYRDFFGPMQVPDRSIFVMGDNRDKSHDSRMWGHLPLFRLKGKAFLVYWPFRQFGLIRHEHGPFKDLGKTPP
ncbi:MAG: signal peptidase I [Candidatus Riflebacteria bacterium]|nr:signal peptidase I [Candidatus Riflebacteria bacterium]